ncbi:MAG: DinB family protein [Anaerolineae bacterium]|nr:DinB family protein [Anaerolineae bacterium]
MSALKPLALARLHAERAHLLWELIGLSAAQLDDESFSAENHRVRDLLPHIAKWDAFEANRLAMIRDGRLAEIESVAVDDTNAAWFDQYRTLSLDQAVAMLQKERNGFVNVVKEIADADFDREVMLPFGRIVSVNAELAMQAQHDADHRHDIVAWKTEHGIQRSPTGPRALLLAGFRASRRALRALIALLPPDEYTTRPVHGSWTLKELLAHLVGWEQYAVACLQVDGREIPFPAGVTTVQRFNEHSIAIRADRSWAEIWSEFQTTRRNLLALLDALSQARLDGPYYTERHPRTLYQWCVDWLHHELEHGAELRVALAIPHTPMYLTRVSQ